MRRVLSIAPLMAVAVLAGCSQIAAIAPVGGNHLTEVRFATIDVLQEQGIALQDVPTCTRGDDGSVACTGTTSTGDDIAASSPGSDPDRVTVTVSSKVVFDGSVSEVIDRAAGVAS